MRRRTSKTRKAVRLAAYRILPAVRAPLDRDERARQGGQRPGARRRERKALWRPDGGGGGGGVGMEEGAGAAHACVEVFEEGVVDYP